LASESFFCSHVKEDAGLIGENLFLNAKDWPVHLIVNVGQITGGRALSNTAELIVDRTVAQAYPTLVGAKVRYWNAAQMSANCGTANN